MSWYDDITNEVVCVCSKQGLTVNVMDKALSNLGKLGQFPGLGAELCKLKIEKLTIYSNNSSDSMLAFLERKNLS